MVGDANDNRPTFPQAQYHTVVKELAARGNIQVLGDFFVCLFVFFTHASHTVPIPTNQITVEYLDTASHRLCALRPHTNIQGRTILFPWPKYNLACKTSLKETRLTNYDDNKATQ